MGGYFTGNGKIIGGPCWCYRLGDGLGEGGLRFSLGFRSPPCLQVLPPSRVPATEPLDCYEHVRDRDRLGPECNPLIAVPGPDRFADNSLHDENRSRLFHEPLTVSADKLEPERRRILVAFFAHNRS